MEVGLMVAHSNGDQSSKVPVLEQKYADLKSKVDGLAEDVGSLRREQQSGFENLRQLVISDRKSEGKNRLGFWAIIVTIVIGVCGLGVTFIGMSGTVLWLLVNSNLTSTTGPLKSQIDFMTGLQSQVASDTRDAVNKFNILQSQYAASEATRKAKEIEIETQFDAQSQINNQQMAQQMRTNAVMWDANKDKLGEWPRYPVYFPNISRKGLMAPE